MSIRTTVNMLATSSLCFFISFTALVHIGPRATFASNPILGIGSLVLLVAGFVFLMKSFHTYSSSELRRG